MLIWHPGLRTVSLELEISCSLDSPAMLDVNAGCPGSPSCVRCECRMPLAVPCASAGSPLLCQLWMQDALVGGRVLFHFPATQNYSQPNNHTETI